MLSYSGPTTLGLKLWVQDGSLELLGKVVKGPSVSEARIEEVDPLRDASLGGMVEGRSLCVFLAVLSHSPIVWGC